MQEKKARECGYKLLGMVLMEECGQDGAEAGVKRTEGCERNLSLMFAFEQMSWDVSTEINPKELGVVNAFRSKASAGNRYEDISDVPTMCVCVCRLFAAKTWEEYDQIAKGDESMEAAVLEMQEIFKSPEERNAYWRQCLYEMDQSTQMHAAERRGEERGLVIGEKRGEKRGERRGEERLNKLMAKLIEENRLDDLKRATASKEWRDQLYKKYSL